MNKTYLKHLLKRNKKLIIIQFLILITLYCYSNINPFTNNIYLYMRLFGLKDIINTYLYACVIIYPIYLISKNYKQNGCDLNLSLPITKEKRYLNELIFGWIIIFIPYIIWIFLNYFTGYLRVETLNSVHILFRSMLIILPMTVIFLLNCLISIKSNHLFDAILIVITSNLAIFILPYTLDVFFSNNSIGSSLSVISDYIFNYDILSVEPLHFASFLFLLICPYQFIRVLLYGQFDMYMLMAIALYLMMVVLLLFLNLITYRNKKSEDYGSKKHNKYMYSSIICLITFMILLLVISQSKLNVVCIWLVTIFCFYIGTFCLAERNISISFKKILVYLLLIACTIIFRITYVYTYGFGCFHDYRSIEEVEKITISTSYGIMVPSNDIRYDKEKLQRLNEELLVIQDELVEKYRNNNLWRKEEDTNSYKYINIMYNQGTDRETGMNFQYSVDLQTYREIIKQFNSLGLITEYN